MKALDVQFGQMALARGSLSVSQLIRCVGKAVENDRNLRDVLIVAGLLTNLEAQAIDEALTTDDEALQKELELGSTIVLDAIDRSIEEFEEVATERFTIDVKLESHDGRYEIKSSLGTGGMGEVFEVTDHTLRRNVALKRLRRGADSEKNRRRLLLEAQVTGLLEHPSIVPVYDLREGEDGNPFYIMRVVEEKSLEGIFEEIRGGESKFSLVQLVSILRQVSLAIHYAHDKGVIHRDLKPENILIGKYGEVYVIDWGIAKIIRDGIGLETTEGASDGLIGTPRYMSPEQARGESGLADGRSDVYSLGAILYEILTLCPVFESEHILALLFKVVYDEPMKPSERAPGRNIPEVLEIMALRALEKEPEKRFQSAEDFAAELEAFLDGVKEADRKRELARVAFEHALQVEATYSEVQNQKKEIDEELAGLKKNAARKSSEENMKIWELEQRSEDVSIEIEYLFGETIRNYSQVLVHEPAMPDAIERIGALYWTRFRDAERTGDKATAVYFEGLVRQFNDGRYDKLLEGGAFLRIEKLPTDRCVRLKSYNLVQRRLEAWDVLEISDHELTIPHGSYLLEIEGEGYATIKIPFVVDRGESIDIKIPEVRCDQIPEDFIYIHEGRFRPFSTRKEHETIETFAIQKHPVTVAQYLKFINSLSAEEAQVHVPKSGAGDYFEYVDGKYVLPSEDEEGDTWELNWPVISVNYFDALRYAEWKSESDGRKYRLPTLMEWLKSARGVDGRIFPWGNAFDRSFCRMRDSLEGRSMPSVVGFHQDDCSPYGVADVAGNVCEWTSTLEEGSGNRSMGGASYNSFKEFCKLDFIISSSETYKFGHYGFRIVVDI